MTGPDKELAVIVGMFLDEPPPGSKYDTCRDCGDQIVIGPDQQRLMAERAERYVFVKVCMPCTTDGLSKAGVNPRVYRAAEGLEL